MPLSVRDILEMPKLSLSLVTGEENVDRPVRWVHVSELEDPTPWLKGGELLLTTGIGIGDSPAEQRAYIKRLSEAGLAGLGVGLGFSYEELPKPIVAAAEQAAFPLFEVAYPVPFIAITEAVFSRIVAEQYEVLQRAVEGQLALTRAVIEGEGVEGVAKALAAVVGGWALLLDLHGIPLAATSRAAGMRAERVWEELRRSRPEGASFSLTLVDRGHHVWIQPVSAHGHVDAFLAVGKPESPSQLDRIVAGHALSLFAIEIGKLRAVANAERRLQGDFLDSLAAGEVPPGEVMRGLARFGFAREADVVALAIEGADSEEVALAAEDLFSRADGGFLISPQASRVHLLLPGDPGRDVEKLRIGLQERLGAEIRVGAGSVVPPSSAGRSLREARYALQVCRLEKWGSAGFENLGTYRLLLSMAEPDALRAFAEALLAPLDQYDREHGGELISSLHTFLEHNAKWETAATHLYVHRHTLRYRMRKVEELTHRDLSSSFDRTEFWLALRARELMAAQAEE